MADTSPPRQLEYFQKGEHPTAHKMNQMVEAINARTPRQGKGNRLVFNSGGFTYNGGRAKPSAPVPLGFEIYASATAGSVEVRPSVVTGFDTVYMPESSGGTALDAATAPTFAITNNTTETIYLKFEMDPDGIAIPGVSPTEYVINTADNDLVSSKITVETSKSGEDLATIDSSGNSNNTGTYFIPLGTATNVSGAITGTQQYMYGPIGCKLCEDGTVSIFPPIIYHSGEIDELA